jgi:hypothetical protein
MVDLLAVRSDEDRLKVDLDGHGSLRRLGRLRAAALLTTPDGTVLHADQRGAFRQTTRVLDPVGAEVGDYRRSSIFTTGGTVTWRGTPYELVVESMWRSRYRLELAGRPVLEVRGRGHGKNPASFSLFDPAVDAGLLLFLVFLLQMFSRNASSATAV